MKLLLMNDPALREVCSPVNPEELDYIKSLVPEMTQIMTKEEGLALAANQVGVLKHFCIMKEGEGTRLFINPEIVNLDELKPTEEGCLSIPGTFGPTMRAMALGLKYKDENFMDVEAEFAGREAVAIQHEVDHLNGKLYTDQLKPMRKQLVLKKHHDFLKMRGKYK